MKKIVILSSLLILTINVVQAYEKSYINYPSPYRNNYFYSPNYYSYPNQYQSLRQYRIMNHNNSRRMRRINKIRALNRLNNYITRNRRYYPNGTLTGYSTPINSDVYQDLGISPMNTKNNSKSPTCNTDLFTSPSGVERHYSNGESVIDFNNLSNKAGVTIIYD